MYKVGIVGYGHVGGIMKELFPDAVIYDRPIKAAEQVNKEYHKEDR